MKRKIRFKLSVKLTFGLLLILIVLPFIELPKSQVPKQQVELHWVYLPGTPLFGEE